MFATTDVNARSKNKKILNIIVLGNIIVGIIKKKKKKTITLILYILSQGAKLNL